MDQQAIETSILSSILLKKDLTVLITCGISDRSFIIFPHVFKFISGFIRDFEEAPTTEIIQSAYPDFFPSEPGNLAFYATKLLDNELRRDIETVMTESFESLKQEPKAALEFLLSNLSTLQKGSIGLTRSYTDRDALDRLELMTKAGGVKYIPSGISALEDVLSYRQGNMIGIVGRTPVGKSTLSIYMGCVAYNEGYRVLFISPELTCYEVNLRWDTMMSALGGVSLSNTALQKGTIDLKAYKEWLSRAATRNDWATYESYASKPFTITSIGVLIEEHKPDITIVDGLSLLRDEKNSAASWEVIKNLSYGLKNLAITKGVAMIVTNQASREAAEETVPSLHHISFGDAFAQAVDKLVMIGLGDNDFTRYVSVPKNRIGRPVMQPILIPFDVDAGRIGS